MATAHTGYYRLCVRPGSRRKARLRILVYGLNYAPELTGIGKYTGEMAEWLATHGHDVHVVTAPPYYPEWNIREDYLNTLYRIERVPGKPLVYRTPLWVPEKPTGLKRIGHLCSFMLGSLPIMLPHIFWKPDLVFTVEPTLFGAPVATLVARTCGAACWLHVQDFEVDAAFDLGLLKRGGIVHEIAHELERFFTLNFDRVSSISAKMIERVAFKGVPRENTVLFPNWVDLDAVYPLDQPPAQNSFRRELADHVPGIEDKVILLYSGNMGTKQGLPTLIPLIEALGDDPRVHFIFCGDGAFRPKLEELVHERSNVTLLPLQPFERLNDLLNAADIHLLPQRAGAADLVMPSRLTGMLASGRPVVATADPGTQIASVVEGHGLVVPTRDPAALLAAVLRLIEDKPLRQTLGAAGREYAAGHLGKDQVLRRFESDLKSLLRHW
jgi:colanic acid biosynthesis glycosyl transferase WcaI